MATSPVEIVNNALILLGASPINTLTDNTKEARTMNRIYENTKRQLIANHPWKGSTKRAPLVASATAPEFDYAYQLPLPADCIRVFDTDLGSETRWTTENRFLLCDSASASIKYAFDQTDTSKLCEGFCEALAYKLAHKSAYAITQSSTLAARLGQEYLVILRDAKAQSAQEGNGAQVEANGWLYSRY